MINIGTLDKRISIVEMKEQKNEYNLLETKPNVLLNCWARIEPLRGREYFEALKIKTTDYVKITIRYRSNITDNMFVRYHNVLFEIQNIIDPYMRHEKLELMCILRNRGDVENGHE